MNNISIKNCPFCREKPDILSWHSPCKSAIMIACRNTENTIDKVCHVAPQVVGDSFEIALQRWNKRAREE